MKRADQNTEWSELAKVPRRSYLGKYRRLKPSQERWIRSLLSLWGLFMVAVVQNTFPAVGCGQ